MEREKFHGRVRGTQANCAHAGCAEPGEFRAPLSPSGFDGPGQWRWLCLEHVRAFNARYDWFAGMSRDEIEAAQMPLGGWARESATFRATAGVDTPPKWSDFSDPLEAISARFRNGVHARASRLPAEELRALKIMGLDEKADRKGIRAAYSKLVRKYHPDRNGGDRQFEKKLQAVVEAYQLLRKSSMFR